MTLLGYGLLIGGTFILGMIFGCVGERVLGDSRRERKAAEAKALVDQGVFQAMRAESVKESAFTDSGFQKRLTPTDLSAAYLMAEDEVLIPVSPGLRPEPPQIESEPSDDGGHTRELPLWVRTVTARVAGVVLTQAFTGGPMAPRVRTMPIEPVAHAVAAGRGSAPAADILARLRAERATAEDVAA